MIYHELQDSDRRVLSSNLEEFPALLLFKGRETENITINKVKNIFRKYDYGSVRLIATEDESLVKSSRISSRTANAYAHMILTVKKMRDESDATYNTLRHNLVTTHAKLQGEIGSIVPEDKLMRCEQHSDQLTLVRAAISSDIDNAADAFLEITKRVVDLQAQIKGFEMLGGRIKLDFAIHNLKRILLNILYPFYEELNKMGIEVKLKILDETAEQYLIRIDYQVFNIAMHHFLNNVVKYAKPYSKVNVFFDGENKILRFLMTSIKIDKDELKIIFNLNVSGKNVKRLAGDGIGMYMVEKSLSLLGARMEIKPDYTEHEMMDETHYVENEFLIYLN